jgi:oligopeptide/dipeptide ABC transporter ATP-binding protein
MSDTLLEAHDLTLSLTRDGETRQILRGVSLEIARGEMVGLVGESGSGKSMFARSLVRILPAGHQLGGTITLDGISLLDASEAEMRTIRAQRVGMIFQDPRAHINPVRTIGDHLTEPLRLLRKQSRANARARAVELLAAVQLADADELLSRYPHELSGGMLQRVMIAGALVSEPELLLADEPTTALDTTTQEEVVALLAELCAERGLAALFITHDLDLAAAVCDRTTVMYAGRSVESQASQALHAAPRHPYTSGLLCSRPSLTGAPKRLPAIPGRPISAHEAPAGCAFSARCRYAEPRCEIEDPVYESYDGGQVACVRTAEIAAEVTAAAVEVTHA